MLLKINIYMNKNYYYYYAFLFLFFEIIFRKKIFINHLKSIIRYLWCYQVCYYVIIDVDRPFNFFQFILEDNNDINVSDEVKIKRSDGNKIHF